MTRKEQAKEKSIELVGNYYNLLGKYPRDFRPFRKDDAKQCALLAVDEIIASDPYNPYGDAGRYDSEEDRIEFVKYYWEDVKEEIKKL